MKKLLFILIFPLSTFTFAISGEDTYLFEKVTPFVKTKNKPLFNADAKIILNDNKSISLITGENGICSVKITRTDPFSIDSSLISILDSVGGQLAFDNFLSKNFGMKFSHIQNDIISAEPLDAKNKYCRFISYNRKLVNSNNILIIDAPFVYKFVLKQKNGNEKLSEQGVYRSVSLPFTDLDYNCNTDNAKCRNQYPSYQGSWPKNVPTNPKLQPFDKFSALPLNGDIKVYIGGWYQSHEKEVNDEIIEDGGEEFIYLATVKGNAVNFVRLGHKFTIGKDYSIIKTLNSSQKAIKYTIAPTGVIYKVQ